MKVFLTWSGLRSRELALFLRTWLKDVIHLVDPWVSDRDIPAGVVWSSEIIANLAAATAGVICVTPENQSEPWVLFEAGALANRLGTGPKVCVYLLGMSKADIKSGPLSLYQLTTADVKDTLKLVHSLNDLLGKSKLPPDMLLRQFERCWPELAHVIAQLSSTEFVSANLLSTSEQVLAEILDEVRRVSKQNDDLLNVVRRSASISDGTEEEAKYLIRAHKVQEDLVQSASAKLRAVAKRQAPELLGLIDGGNLLYDDDGMYEISVRDMAADDTCREEIREKLNEIAREAGIGWGLHVRFVGIGEQ